MRLFDLACGLTSGWTQVFIGQPFDLLKTKYQSPGSGSVGAWTMIKNIYKQSGLKGFYKGTSSMLVGYAGVIGVQLFAYQWIKRSIFKYWGHRSGQYDPDQLKLWEVALSGWIVGWGAGTIFCPTEYAKIQKQLFPELAKQGSMALLIRQVKNKGIKSVFRGFWSTCMRETIGCAAYYSSYEWTVRRFANGPRQDAAGWVYFLAGGVAGFCFYLATYPIDTFKTNFQAGNSWKEALKMAFDPSTMKGLKFALMRGVLMTGGGFFVYENTQKLSRQLEKKLEVL